MTNSTRTGPAPKDGSSRKPFSESDEPHGPAAPIRSDQPARAVWWSQTGSNRRPHACKARALPTELWPHSPEANVSILEWPQAPAAASAALADARPERQRCRSGRAFGPKGRKREARRASWRVPLTKMVGLGRLELPTSRLSSARSNQLSYKPGARDRLRRGRTMPEDQVRSRRARVSPKETAHPERKRNEDGKVPQKVPDWDLCVPSVPIARFGKNRPEGTSLERR
jgi:hypothetical protein